MVTSCLLVLLSSCPPVFLFSIRLRGLRTKTVRLQSQTGPEQQNQRQQKHQQHPRQPQAQQRTTVEEAEEEERRRRQ
jgi:hypothetical protein